MINFIQFIIGFLAWIGSSTLLKMIFNKYKLFEEHSSFLSSFLSGIIIIILYNIQIKLMSKEIDVDLNEFYRDLQSYYEKMAIDNPEKLKEEINNLELDVLKDLIKNRVFDNLHEFIEPIKE
jgi:hypothetical protein